MKIKEEETTFLLKKTTFKEKKTGVVFGCFCWKWGARGTIFASERQMALDKNHEKPLASFEAQGHAAGLNVELESLAAFARP